MVALILALTLAVTQSSPAQTPPPQARFSAATDLVTVELFYLRSGKPVTGLTAKDFVLRVDKQTREIESVQYITEDGKKPFYLLAFRPIDRERGSGPHTAEITATIQKREVTAIYRFTVPVRRIGRASDLRSTRPILTARDEPWYACWRSPKPRQDLLMIGKTIGWYQVLAKLGEGGMSARGRSARARQAALPRVGVGRLRAEGASASLAEALAEARPHAHQRMRTPSPCR